MYHSNCGPPYLLCRDSFVHSFISYLLTRSRALTHQLTHRLSHSPTLSLADPGEKEQGQKPPPAPDPTGAAIQISPPSQKRPNESLARRLVNRKWKNSKEILTLSWPKNTTFRACGAVTPLSIPYSLKFKSCNGKIKEDPMDRLTVGPLALS